jgi:multicomponent Na+:H+ antiporter subunit F
MGELLIEIAAGITLLSLLISLIRFLKGPHKVDRIISFDVMTISSIALIGFIAAMAGKVIYLDVALVYGILGFLGVIIVARYLEKGF